MPGSVTYIRRSEKIFLYSSLPSLVHHKSMNKAPNTSKQYLLARQTVFRFTIVKLDDVKQLTLNILLNVYLFGNAEVFISVILHTLCSYLLTLPTQESGILLKDKGSNGTFLFHPC